MYFQIIKNAIKIILFYFYSLRGKQASGSPDKIGGGKPTPPPMDIYNVARDLQSVSGL